MKIRTNDHFIYSGLQGLSNFLIHENYSSKFILVDENTKKKCLPNLNKIVNNREFKIIEIKSGEVHKNLETVKSFWDTLSLQNADRHSLLINLGGGVICDLGGFGASTFKRGIDFINLPTTLLAQVDASVGGKTGIDLDCDQFLLKNQIGLFSFPKAVFIYPEFLKTLSRSEFLSGFAEVIKHALIKDKKYWNFLLKFSLRKISRVNFQELEKIIFRSIVIKNEIVKKDPLEKGLRKVLNFGHTIGHAIESYSLANDKRALFHGEAIAIGIICESYLSHKIAGLKKQELKEVSSYLKKIFPPYIIKKNKFRELIDLMRNDKKNIGERINFSLLKRIGNCKINYYCDSALIYEALEYYSDLQNDKQ